MRWHALALYICIYTIYLYIQYIFAFYIEHTHTYIYIYMYIYVHMICRHCDIGPVKANAAGTCHRHWGTTFCLAVWLCPTGMT